MTTPILRIISDITDIPVAKWDALSGGDPFTSHAYLHALQASGCATAEFGWQPRFITLWQDDNLIGAMPLYLKMNSYGEHVFDFAWAEAYQRHGLDYYPKLVCLVPFAPVTGPRLLASTEKNKETLLDAALAMAKGELAGDDSPLSLQERGDGGVSSLHCLFLNEADVRVAQSRGMMLRQDVQFHWQNNNYRDFEDFLAALSRDKRKRIKQDRRRVQDAGITLQCITGDAATEEQWSFFASCYAYKRQTHYSPPALNDDFFHRIGVSMPHHALLVIASREGRMIASALNIMTDEILYGRSWGAFEFHSGLHFEACFYQAIEFCIARGIKAFEGGSGGEHKLSRGFLPVTTHSAHWLAHPEFSRAVENYLQRESDAVAEYVDELNEHSPFKNS